MSVGTDQRDKTVAFAFTAYAALNDVRHDDNGLLHDAATQDFLRKMLAGYVAWITKLKKDS